MRECVLDFETASACDLKQAGAWRYAEDPTTEILCAAFIATGETEPSLWRPDGGGTAALAPLAGDPNTIFIAHNAGFEKAIWRRIMVPEFGFPDIPNSRWRDTMASCAMRVIPQQLEKALLALRLPHEKDMEGSRLTRAMSKPNRKGYYDRDPEKLQRVYEYCRQDIRGEVDIWQRLGPLPSGEHQVWLLDQRINERGVRLDLEYVRAAQVVVDRATVPLAAEFRSLTGGLEFTQRDKIMRWVREQGADVPDLKKETLDAILGGEDDDADDSRGGYESFAEDGVLATDEGGAGGVIRLPASVHRALSIRRLIGSASVKKLKRMEACVCADGRVRGTLQYHGAGPGRWAGRLLQPQNFPRGTTKLDGEAPDPQIMVDAIQSRDPDFVEATLGPAVETVVSGLRHAIVASPGRKLVAGDFAGIEARFVLALAGQHDKTALMASGKDVYLDMAEDIYGAPKGSMNKKTHAAERQIGKNSVLGLGFAMGAQKFHDRYCSDQPLEFAENVVKTYRKEWAPCVPKLWYALENAAARTVKDGNPREEYGVCFALEDGWLTARLPSGRKLWYYDPRSERVLAPWSTPEEPEYKLAYTYRAPKMGRFITIYGFGGLVTENVIQASARDLMVSAMFKCEREGLPVVLTVHDEIVCEPEENGPDEKVLAQIMEDVPGWVRDIQVPVAVEAWSGERYKK